MQKVRVGIIALATSATILAPAGSVSATTRSASSQTTTAAAAVCSLLCFDLYEDGLRVGHDVDAITAADFCWGGEPSLPIVMVAIGVSIACDRYQGHQRSITRTK
jgi:hypothetical protein